MNEELAEKLPCPRLPVFIGPVVDCAQVLFLPVKLNQAVRQYYESKLPPAASDAAWLRNSCIPTTAEVQDLVDEGQEESIVELAPNQVVGAWASKEAYLKAHYELLREDAVRPLREAVCQIRATPAASEDTFSGKVGIYEKVHIIGFTPSTQGFAVRISFSLGRVGKKVEWRQTDRLKPGTMVALTPDHDNFMKTAIVATVAARSASATDLDPPELDLYFARAAELEIDPSTEWLMIEARGSYFEAAKHVLLTLQHMQNEPFPMMEHLVQVKTEVEAPSYLKANPRLNLSSVFPDSKGTSYHSVNGLCQWPNTADSELDASQRAALHRILTRRLAIVQGPPGTGKTFVSVKALEIMLASRKEGDPPIIVACQTNHALDQLLRHVAKFEPAFARLGSRSKDQEVIKPRTIFELRKTVSQASLPGCVAGYARKLSRSIEKEIIQLLEPFGVSTNALDPHVLCKYKLLSEQQINSLEAGAARWVQTELAATTQAQSPFNVWLTGKLLPVPHKLKAEDFGFDFEEADLELEQLHEAEAEAGLQEEDDQNGLLGTLHKLADNFTCAKVPRSEEEKALAMLNAQQDLWKIPEAYRGAIYRHLQARLKTKVTALLRGKVQAFNDAISKSRIGRWERDEVILRDQKIIGMTTTGLNINRGLLAALGCKIALIEEAAETLEAPIISACLPTMEHLILVGDHKQLRPHCQVKAHEDEPWYLNISMFERLVGNNFPMSTLTRQRRMIPEVRRILRPIYQSIIQDHASVTGRPDVPGMGGVNSWFFSHVSNESRDELMSFKNVEEAAIIVEFVQYLIKNGTLAQEITILTHYKGQRKLIMRLLRKLVTPFPSSGVIVVTVDSYQGEENKVVILSLVRSNEANSIGFLNVDNRTCVALSRARDGFYIFGNALLLATNPTWNKVIAIMAGRNKKDPLPQIRPIRFSDMLPIQCLKHSKTTEMRSSSDWKNNSGGCQERCTDALTCGHRCQQTCHPYSHDIVQCEAACGKKLACGHKCPKLCSEPCDCRACPKKAARPEAPPKPCRSNSNGSKESTSSWRVYAVEQEARHRAASSLQPSPVKALALSSDRNGSPLRREVLNTEFGLIDLAEDVEEASSSSNVTSLSSWNGDVLIPQNTSAIRFMPGPFAAEQGDAENTMTLSISLMD